MDPDCLRYCLTDSERTQFEEDGFFIVPDALSAEELETLATAVDIAAERYQSERGLGFVEYLNILDAIGREACFLDLLDWPKTFPKVWGILGWNIQLYHSQIIITPPKPAFNDGTAPRALDWHQDSGRLNLELEGDPRPRVSLKVAYFLTDTRIPDSGRFSVVPGSHLRNHLEIPAAGTGNPEGAVEISVPPGAAVFFDRRTWHVGSPNQSDQTRKVMFMGYSYRWLRPRDDMTVAHLMERCDPVRRQLLGAATGGFGYTSPSEADVPLKDWIRKHAGEEAVAR